VCVGDMWGTILDNVVLKVHMEDFWNWRLPVDKSFYLCLVASLELSCC
jgi:hypothetical protein